MKNEVNKNTQPPKSETDKPMVKGRMRRLVRFLRLRWIKLHRGRIYKCKRCCDSGLIATGWDGYIQGRCSCPKGDKYKSKHGICLL